MGQTQNSEEKIFVYTTIAGKCISECQLQQTASFPAISSDYFSTPRTVERKGTRGQG